MFHRPEVEFQSSLASWYWTSQEEAIWARRRPTMLHTWIPPLTKDRKGWNILIKLWDSSHMHESKDFYKARIVSKTESSRLNKVKVKLLSHVRLSATPWTVAYQASPSMGFPRQEYWNGLPFPSPANLPDSGIKPRSPALQADALPSEPPGKPRLNKMWPLLSRSHNLLCHINALIDHYQMTCQKKVEHLHPHSIESILKLRKI